MLLPAKVEFRIKKSILAVIGFFKFFFFGWGKSGINLGFWETCGKRLPPGIDSPQMSQRKSKANYTHRSTDRFNGLESLSKVQTQQVTALTISRLVYRVNNDNNSTTQLKITSAYRLYWTLHANGLRVNFRSLTPIIHGYLTKSLIELIWSITWVFCLQLKSAQSRNHKY